MAGIKLGEHPVHQCREICVVEWGARDAGHANEKLPPALYVEEAGDVAGNGGHLVSGARPVDAMAALALEHPGQPISRIVIGQHRR